MPKRIHKLTIVMTRKRHKRCENRNILLGDSRALAKRRTRHIREAVAKINVKTTSITRLLDIIVDAGTMYPLPDYSFGLEAA